MNRIRTIGRGGLGVVALYQDTDGRFYAVKQMLQPWAKDHHKRFMREIRIMAGLAHQNIIKLVNYDMKFGNPYYVMPYYPDGSLRDRMSQYRKAGLGFSSTGASGIIFHLAGALSFAHKQGIVHRDLKPENILFNGTQPILADWGIGKFIHQQSGMLPGYGIGTPVYCAPEQWQTGQADAKSDVYSLGVIYRELLTGSVNGVIQDYRIEAIVARMTSYWPNHRYQNMDQVRLAIHNLSVVNEKDPMGEFWKGVAVVALGVAGIYVLGRLLGGE